MGVSPVLPRYPAKVTCTGYAGLASEDPQAVIRHVQRDRSNQGCRFKSRRTSSATRSSD